MSEGDRIAIFPLSNVAMFPGIQCPLHIFEPRYRQMVEHALSGDGRIGMATIRPECLDDIQGDPPLFEIGCAGDITEHQKLPDGRYNLVLMGNQRFRILSEEPRSAGRQFRTANIKLLDDLQPDEHADRIAKLRPALIKLASSFIARSDPRRAARFAQQDLGSVDNVSLVNALSNSFPLSAVEKQQLLDADAIAERFDRLMGVLELRLAESGALGAASSKTVH
jgi:Lon protease-like protein